MISLMKRNLQNSNSTEEGYGAFSYSHSQLDNVIAYIMNQKEHQEKNI